MKCFEIGAIRNRIKKLGKINRKHEMFWNHKCFQSTPRKSKLTVNMKCFEMN